MRQPARPRRPHAALRTIGGGHYPALDCPGHARGFSAELAHGLRKPPATGGTDCRGRSITRHRRYPWENPPEDLSASGWAPHAGPAQSGRGRSTLPRRGAGSIHLTYLAKFFDAVEVNSTFYRIPAPTMTKLWVERVAGYSAFRFTAKLWQGFTHEAQTTAQDTVAFREAMAPLHNAGKLGAVLLQFPIASTTRPTCAPIYAGWSTPFRRSRWSSMCAIAPETCRRSMSSCRSWASASATSISRRCRTRLD
jgi:Protein of unknown function DUF72